MEDKEFLGELCGKYLTMPPSNEGGKMKFSKFIYATLASFFGMLVPFFPMPTFTFQVWLTMLVIANVVLLLLSVFAFRGAKLMIPLSYAFAVIMFLNGLLHITGSFFLGRFLPGVYSSPVLLIASSFLILRARQID